MPRYGLAQMPEKSEIGDVCLVLLIAPDTDLIVCANVGAANAAAKAIRTKSRHCSVILPSRSKPPRAPRGPATAFVGAGRTLAWGEEVRLDIYMYGRYDHLSSVRP